MALSDVSFDSGLSKHKFGRSNIRYSPDGRIVTGDDNSLPRGRSYGAARDFDEYRGHDAYEDRREKARQAFYEYHGAYPSYETRSVQQLAPVHNSRENRSSAQPYQQDNPQKSRTSYWRSDTAPGWNQRERSVERYDSSREHSTRDNNSFPTSYPASYQGYSIQPPRVPPMDHRRGLPRSTDPYNPKPDWHTPIVGDYHYDKTGLIAVRNHNGEQGILGKWYRKRRDSPWSVIFVSIGLFTILCGIINVMFCLDYHYYCRFWAGFIVLEFGIFGLVHGGDWRTAWKSYCYVLLGILSVLAAFTSTALLFEKLIPQIKLLYDLGNTAYADLQKARTDKPHVSIENDSWVWVCFGFDLTTFCLFTLTYLAGHASASCASQFYDFNWKTIRTCVPYKQPRFFNPFGQITLGEVMALSGLCVRYVCYSYSTDTEWYKYWSPVWAGALTAIAGACAAGATKRSDNKLLMLSAIFLELISGASAVVAVVFCCIGMSDNIKTIEDVLNLPGKTKDHITASACLYAFATAVCLIQVAFAIGVLSRLFSYLLSSRNQGYYGGPRGNNSVNSFDSRSHATTVTNQPQRDRYGRYLGTNNISKNYWKSY